MRWWIPIGSVLAVALVVGVVALAVGVSGSPASVSQPVAAAASDVSEPPERGRGDGQGPPSWVGPPSVDGQRGNHGHRAWRDAWKNLTLKQREQTMARFAEEHRVGMRAWARCVADGGDDCQKPMPPGLAKKQLRP